MASAPSRQSRPIIRRDSLSSAARWKAQDSICPTPMPVPPEASENSAPSLLPAAPERLVKLHDRQQLVAPRLREAQLRVEQLAVGVERFEQVRHAAVVAEVGEARAIPECRDEQLALGANLPHLAIGDQRVRHLAEGVLDSPLVVDQQEVPLRLREPHVRLEPSAVEDGL